MVAFDRNMNKHQTWQFRLFCCCQNLNKTIYLALPAFIFYYLICAASISGVEVYRVGTFNIRALGKAKMRHPVVAPILLRIISGYDILAIQELRDKSQSTMPKVKKLLNSGPGQWSFATGPRLGRNSYKEQYVYVFRSDRFKLLKIKTFPDLKDVFAREPTAALFSIDHHNEKLVVLNYHIAPDDAAFEISHINSSVKWAMRAFKVNNLIVLGDFNADCSYYNEKFLQKDAGAFGLHWLTGNQVDTNLAESYCTYDRIGVTGKALKWYKGREGVIRFDLADFTTPPDLSVELQTTHHAWYELMQRASTKFIHKGVVRHLNLQRISDHYPLWIELEL